MYRKLMHYLRDEAPENGDAGAGDSKDLAAQLEATREKLRQESEARARAEGVAEGVRTAAASRTEEPRREERPEKFTRGQLDAMVEKGTIDRATADSYWDMQLRNEVTQQVSDRIWGRLTERDRSTKLNAEISAYQEAFPDSNKPGSDTHKKMQAEYNRLVNDLGYEKGAATELLAAKAVLGSLPKKAVKEVTRDSQESHQETGGSGSGVSGRQDSKSKDPAVRMGLSEREKSYYDDCIKKGVYKDWADVEDTMKHSNPNLRKRYNERSA